MTGFKVISFIFAESIQKRDYEQSDFGLAIYPQAEITDHPDGIRGYHRISR
ncbi:MAG: hypothetical protein LUF04_08685 [Bacteroides sp.]|nr:hypothetical protein [Bacteroides sp.]